MGILSRRTVVLVALLVVAPGVALSQVRYRAGHEVDPRLVELREEVLGHHVEVLRLDCLNAHYRREVTLFGNGTIRVREGTLEAPEMWLGELDRATTSALIERLQLADLSEETPQSRTVVGEWVDSCTYELDLPGVDSQRFQFERLDALSLPLQTSLNVAITALGMVDRSAPSESERRLSTRYEPSRGDVLVGLDGQDYRVTGFANNETVVELIGVDAPVVRYYAVADLHNHFVRLK